MAFESLPVTLGWWDVLQTDNEGPCPYSTRKGMWKSLSGQWWLAKAGRSGLAEQTSAHAIVEPVSEDTSGESASRLA